ncbi:hypothetical protein TNCT_289221 [Trichonephila clavata]|uniref:Uncharacterized protein n=1 Tax=Trichonephila clavata TaxID=2740835 RepID=A0A8X6GYL0_TRICU|nr:hypothetical protein TNCT_289221 [Trichonephila clavata]
MLVVWILETSLCLFFTFIADHIRNHLDLVSFFEILGCVLVIDLMKKLIEILLESKIMNQESKMTVKRAEEKRDITRVPTVHSLMIYKMCEGLDLLVKLAAVQDNKMWVARNMPQDRKKRPVPKVHSRTILMFCEALNIDAELSHSTEKEYVTHNELKRVKTVPIIHSTMVLKMCHALGLSAKLDAEL